VCIDIQYKEKNSWPYSAVGFAPIDVCVGNEYQCHYDAGMQNSKDQTPIQETSFYHISHMCVIGYPIIQTLVQLHFM
jgi:hypothetical protein